MEGVIQVTVGVDAQVDAVIYWGKEQLVRLQRYLTYKTTFFALEGEP